ncbi:MFS transporter [Rahnella victoriana]|uniref:MFS transporter n=1 Tax=Rahnella victoriana TaxID=1510570 RepID=UPI000BB1B79A|nr:MFS transporter [Rahnella victoriana]PBI77881.1 permease [Rahnella victoriana]PKB89968.1 permease [Ewingella americana]TBX32267.1 MFS transporter [Rahnella victoriana]UHM93168.1 MFS transporter [Rahnella victoriana]
MLQINKIGGVTLLAVACLTIMVGCVIVPGLTSISDALNVKGAESWLVTLPSLGVVLLGPLAGKFMERAGLYRALCLGLFLYGLLGSAGAFLSGYITVFADRFLLGGATALIMTAGTGLISVFYNGPERMKMIARQGMSIELGGVIFLFIGGLLAAAGWRWPFALYLFAWLMLLMVLMFVPRPDNRAESEQIKTDVSHGATSPAVLMTWAAALMSMIVFFTAIVVLPLHLHKMGNTESQTGYFLSFVSLVAVCGAWLMPKLVSRYSDFSTLSIAFGFYALAHLIFAFATSMPFLIPGGIALGLGFGFSVPLVNHLIVELSSNAVRGRNLARLSMAIFLGQFLSAFMAYLPGTTSTVFLSAAVIGALFSVFIKFRAPARVAPYT